MRNNQLSFRKRGRNTLHYPCMIQTLTSPQFISVCGGEPGAMKPTSMIWILVGFGGILLYLNELEQ